MRALHGYRAVGLAAMLIVVGLLAEELATLLLGTVIAVILALPLAAAADRAQRRGLPRALGAVAALALVAAILTGLGLVLVPEFVAQVKQFGDRLPTILTSVGHQLHTQGLHVGNLSAQINHFIDGYTHNPKRLIGPLGQAGGALAVGAIALVVVAVVAFTLAVEPEPAIDFVLHLFPSDRRPLVRDVMGRVRTAWIGWMTAVGVDMLVLGTLLWAGMAIVGLPFAIGFATFSALMTVIPNYGSVISAVPPILVGLAHSPVQGALVLLVFVIVNQIEGNLLLPLIMARTVDMHPAVVSIGLLLVGALLGVIGVFVAIPLMSLVIILVQALWVEPLEAAAALPNEPPVGVLATDPSGG